MSYLLVIAIAFLATYLVTEINTVLIKGRAAYGKVLLDFNDRISEVVKAGLSKYDKQSEEELNEDINPENLEDFLILLSLVAILHDVNAECVRVHNNPFMYVPNAEKRLSKKFRKHLPTLNLAYKKFIA